jgi:hypothetical protein
MTSLAIDSSTYTPGETHTEVTENPKFSFRCAKRLFSVWTKPVPEGAEVYVACELGHLPYSAENRERRRNGLMILSAAGAAISARLILTDFHKISLLANVTIPDIEDSKAIISAAAASVVGMLPMIELMDSCVVPTPGST